MHLFSRKKFEDPFELPGIKTAIDIGKAPRFNRQRLRNPSRFFFERVQKIERLAILEALHVPVRERAIDRISQQDDEFDLPVVIPNPLHCRFPIQITRRDFAGYCLSRRREAEEGRSCDRPKLSMQQVVIDRPGKNFVVVEEMQLLPLWQRDLWMLSQEIMERGRARLLRARDDEIEPFNLSTFNAKHVSNRDTALARCPRLSALQLTRQLFVTSKGHLRS